MHTPNLGHGKSVPLPATPLYTGPWNNGMGTPVGGLVPLQPAEQARAVALASTSQNLHNWASTLPTLWAIQDAFPLLAGNDLFQAETNCNYARTFLAPLGAASTGWCPRVFNCMPDPTGHKLYIEGMVIPNAGSFSSNLDVAHHPHWEGLHLSDLPALFQAAMDFAQKYGPYNN